MPKSYLQTIIEKYGDAMPSDEPKDQQKDYELFVGIDPSAAGFRPPSSEEIYEEMRKTVEQTILYGRSRNPPLDFTGMDTGPTSASIRKPDPKQSLIDAERRARAEVADWLIDPTSINVTWDDIAGNEEAHRAMREAIEWPVKYAELYRFYDKKPTKGVLLWGPPGCGKTMFGKAAATIISQLYGKKVAMILVKASELQSTYIGITEQRIKAIFAYARAYKALHGHQLVVFMDEADAMLPARDPGPGRRGATYWEASNVATFLAEMDGLETSDALVILATNRQDAIDPAILRDGRIDRQVKICRPTFEAAVVIATKAFQDIPGSGFGRAAHMIDELFSPYRNLMVIQHEKGKDYFNLSHCVSGAMIVGLVERAKAYAFHRDITAGTMTGVGIEDINKAIEEVHREQMAMIDTYALREFGQAIGAPVLSINRVDPEIKYADKSVLN